MNDISVQNDRRSVLKEALLAVEEMQSKLERVEGQQTEPIAIIGMGCRFPGGANDPATFWELLRSGTDLITRVPEDRWDNSDGGNTRPGSADDTDLLWGSFLDQVDGFDAGFFGISPREIERMDPQHRLFLEVAWEALERAGQPLEQLAESATGVFVGVINNDHLRLQIAYDSVANFDIYDITGNAIHAIGGRIAYMLGLHGPSMAIDTACSSSLVAVQQACQSLRAGACDRALAGGVNLILAPDLALPMIKAGMLAPDGHCKTFDAQADGFVRGEGVGVLVLKRLRDAQAAGDPILALIRSTAVNQDGASSGLTVPSGHAQQALLRQALNQAHLTPADVSYVEAHGTGTSLGDPIELEALSVVLGAPRPATQPLWVGSVKTNLGHLEGAAGIVGVIKTVLALQHEAIPPHLHFQTPSPHLDWTQAQLQVPTTLTPWPRTPAMPRRAGVSSFGLSGTNAHLIIEEAPSPPSAAASGTLSDQPVLVPISARDPEALREYVQKYHTQLVTDSDPVLADLAYTSSRCRTHHGYRVALAGYTATELAAQCQAFLQGEARTGLANGRAVPGRPPKIVFVCPGQGSQWPGMARDLLAHDPVVAQVLTQVAQAFQPYVTWDLLAVLQTDPDPAAPWPIDVIQPTLFALTLALAARWQHWGITPSAYIGHSMGEVAAAYLAGALALDAAARIICRRSQLLRRVSGQGAMAVVDLPVAQAAAAIAAYPTQLAVAVCNSPHSTVLAGDPTALDAVVAQLQQQNVFCRPIAVDVASHSPQMDPLRTDLLTALGDLQPQAGSVPLYSTVDAQVIDGAGCDAAYWVRNLREPVQFATAVQQALAAGHTLFVELSPHPILLPAVKEGMVAAGETGQALPSLQREMPSQERLLMTLGALYGQGAGVNWSALYPHGSYVPLPTYPWQREVFPRKIKPQRAGLRTKSAHTTWGQQMSAHPLLGAQWESAASAGMYTWELSLSTQRHPYLADHRVQGDVVVPAAAYIELALAAATELFGDQSPELEELSFHTMLVLPEDEERRGQMVITTNPSDRTHFAIYSRTTEAQSTTTHWTLHVSGFIRLNESHVTQPEPAILAIDELQRRCEEILPADTLYAEMAARGLAFGPCFKGVQQCWRRDTEALAQLQLPASIQEDINEYYAHPALLDACFQALGPSVSRRNKEASAGASFLPISMERLRVYGPTSVARWSYAQLREGDSQEQINGDMWLLDAEGNVLLEARGLKLQRLGTPDEADVSKWFYELLWEPSKLPIPETPADLHGTWLLLADDLGVSEQLKGMLTSRGAHCLIVSRGSHFHQVADDQYVVNPASAHDLLQMLKVVDDRKQGCRGIVHLWSLAEQVPESTTAADLQTFQVRGCESVLHLVQALVQQGWRDMPRLWLVTNGARAAGEATNDVAVAQAPIWGLGRVVGHEHPILRCTQVDVSIEVADAEIQQLFAELAANDDEDQVVLRSADRYCGRLVPYAAQAAPETPERQFPANGQPFRLEITNPGILDDLALRAVNYSAPGPGEVEIEVVAAGLNFSDVMQAMGIYPNSFAGSVVLGGECAGRISAVGPNVTKFQVGDAVIACAPYSLGTHVITRTEFVVHKPEQLTFADAATIPMAFMTAIYALQELGRLQQGERVLIHSASGGVGLAAIQVAQALGAEIFATAGSPEKRTFLNSLGVQHIMDSRSLAFADEVLSATEGQGVDVVLNSLTGEALVKGLSILRPYGRFLEIGKRDIYEDSRVGLLPFQNNLSFCAIDLQRLFIERPALIATLLNEVVARLADGTYTPLPMTIFQAAQSADAFRYMAQAKHIGKIVMSFEDRDVVIAPALDRDASIVHPNATYLITGGLGGLGLAVAQWMVEQGARHLILLGRSGASANAQEAIAAMEQSGAQIVTARADVAQIEQLTKVLGDIAQDMPPLRGVVHSAGVLDDSTLLHLNLQQFHRVMAPKLAGAWNLHRLTQDQSLDFFVLFSSASALLGSPGQGNYAAANTFLDALAHYRRAHGLPALSINWGPWSDVGLAAHDQLMGRFSALGFDSLTPSQGIAALEQLLHHQPPQMTVMRFNARQWRQSYPNAEAVRLFQHIMREQSDDDASRHQEDTVRVALLAIEPGPKRRNHLETHVRDQIAQVLRISPSRIDIQTPLGEFGLDSLMALEFRNRLESSLQLSLPATLVWAYPTVSALANHLAEKLEVPLDESEATDTAQKGDPDPQAEALAQVTRLSDDEAESLLLEKLAALD